MPEMYESFTRLLDLYSGVFPTTTHTAPTYADLKALIPKTVPGVYIVKQTANEGRVLYIGSSGKIHKGMASSGSSIHSRMFGSSTPYHFDTAADTFCYGPTTPGVPPAGYNTVVPVSSISVTCLAVTNPKAPCALEHLLIQGHITEFHDLPDANQMI